MTHRTEDADLYLDGLTRRIGAKRAVVASAEGLLVAGAGADLDTLEELAAYAPSQLPKREKRPEGMKTTRIEIPGHRLYLAAIGATPPAEAANDLAKILER